jgi:hypothetical protein
MNFIATGSGVVANTTRNISVNGLSINELDSSKLNVNIAPDSNEAAIIRWNNDSSIIEYSFKSSNPQNLKLKRSSRGTYASPSNIASGDVLQYESTQARVANAWEEVLREETVATGANAFLHKLQAPVNTKLQEVNIGNGTTDNEYVVEKNTVSEDHYETKFLSAPDYVHNWYYARGTRDAPIQLPNNTNIYRNLVQARDINQYFTIYESHINYDEDGSTLVQDLKQSPSKYKWQLANIDIYEIAPGVHLPLVSGVDFGSTAHRWNTIYSVNALNVSSDRTMKREIAPLAHSLEFVKQLRPVEYKFNEDIENSNKVHMGLIAQEVEEALNDDKYFMLNKEDGKYSLAYTELIPVLINCIKDLSQKVERLEFLTRKYNLV